MNYKKVTILTSVVILLLIAIVGIINYSQVGQENMFFKKEHKFNQENKAFNQYRSSSQCLAKCTNEGGYNCGASYVICCKNEASCVDKWGMKACNIKKKQFTCDE
ncbi:transmembrane protein, putative (macronuclear) [Tetrahymena thermophila SB210]|uniref:Transmembrane protein, putative n=1 Tax=Tetrahymena thermophila (strain SB210) TaxID=312017 RepID=I7MEQ2_TETTS|nr:transmembrane protein, putative [Tetrahymena thermophila SB210]EAR97353.1 transmembrane protein, putative [Tetrahymena thermophila SB210]|eukprot:XP_001017598.1 transmembrane protein, putative [Tetrahymena thermophila SB210]